MLCHTIFGSSQRGHSLLRSILRELCRLIAFMQALMGRVLQSQQNMIRHYSFMLRTAPAQRGANKRMTCTRTDTLFWLPVSGYNAFGNSFEAWGFGTSYLSLLNLTLPSTLSVKSPSALPPRNFPWVSDPYNILPHKNPTSQHLSKPLTPCRNCRTYGNLLSSTFCLHIRLLSTAIVW